MMRMYERYQEDPVFHSLVDMMTAELLKGQFTPTEMREAAMLAQIRYEEMTPPRRVIFTADDIRSGRV